MANDSPDGRGCGQIGSLCPSTKGYKKKILDIVSLKRSGEVNKMALGKYVKPNVIGPMEKPIERVMFRGQAIPMEGRAKFDGMSIYNTRRCITALSLPAKHGRYVFVGVRNEFQGESTFKFSSEASEILLFDQSLNLRQSLSFDFGYCRKIETLQEGEVIRCVALFSDGFVRKFDFEEGVRNVMLVEPGGIVNFEISWSHDLIFATDGASLVWISKNSVVSVFGDVKGLITSIAIKEKTSDGRVPLEFYALSLGGKILRFDCKFQERRRISFPSGYTIIRYLARMDMVIIVDTLSNVTRALYDGGDAQRTTTVLNHSLSCCRAYDKRVLVGGFDGTIRYAKINKRSARARTIFQLARKDDEVVLAHLDDELRLLDPQGRLFNDHSEKVVGLCVGSEHLFAAYECGIVVGLGLL